MSIKEMIKSNNKRNKECLYAYNINEHQKIRKKELPNFNNVHKNIYDDLIEYDNKYKSYQRKLHNNKSTSIKELVYASKRIPHIWSDKNSYVSDLYRTLSQDRNFVSYLAKSSQKEILRTSPSSFNSGKYNNNSGSNNNQIKLNESDKKCKIVSPVPPSTYTNKCKEINNVIEEYKLLYPLKILPYNNSCRNKLLLTEVENNDSKTKLPVITEQNKEHNNVETNSITITNNTDELSHRSNYEKYKHTNYNNTNTSDTNNSIKSLYVNKSRFFKSTLYANLVQGNKIEIENEKRKSFNKKGLSIYLNGNHHDSMKRIPIHNLKIKEKLEDINYFGPKYSHCLPCGNRNNEFYNRMENGQCFKLLNYLKDIRKGS